MPNTLARVRRFTYFLGLVLLVYAMGPSACRSDSQPPSAVSDQATSTEVQEKATPQKTGTLQDVRNKKSSNKSINPAKAPVLNPKIKAPARKDAASAADSQPFEGTKLTVAYTANVIGELEPCG